MESGLPRPLAKTAIVNCVAIAVDRDGGGRSDTVGETDRDKK